MFVQIWHALLQSKEKISIPNRNESNNIQIFILILYTAQRPIVILPSQ